MPSSKISTQHARLFLSPRLENASYVVGVRGLVGGVFRRRANRNINLHRGEEVRGSAPFMGHFSNTSTDPLGYPPVFAQRESFSHNDDVIRTELLNSIYNYQTISLAAIPSYSEAFRSFKLSRDGPCRQPHHPHVPRRSSATTTSRIIHNISHQPCKRRRHSRPSQY